MAYRFKVERIGVIPLRIPFSDGGGAAGLMPQKWTHLDIALVRVESAEGAVGWGEAFAYSCTSATVAAVRDMVAPLVVGREITDIAALNYELQHKLHIQGRYGITIFAIGGVGTLRSGTSPRKRKAPRLPSCWADASATACPPTPALCATASRRSCARWR